MDVGIEKEEQTGDTRGQKIQIHNTYSPVTEARHHQLPQQAILFIKPADASL